MDLSKVNTLAKDVTENLDKFGVGYHDRQNLQFIWENFVTGIIEIVVWCTMMMTILKRAALWT